MKQIVNILKGSEYFPYQLCTLHPPLYLCGAVTRDCSKTLHIEASLLFLSDPESPWSTRPPGQQVNHLDREERDKRMHDADIFFKKERASSTKTVTN